MNHTPTPWRVGRSGSVVSDSSEGITISGATGKQDVDYYGGNLIAESVSLENAAFIVESVNFYDRVHSDKGYRLHFDYLAGALTCEEEIPGITQTLDGKMEQAYGASYFICETITFSAATKIAELLGGEIQCVSLR
jgi:hypothetical protein